MCRILIWRPGGTVSKLAGTRLKNQKLYTLDFHLCKLFRIQKLLSKSKSRAQSSFYYEGVFFENIFQVKIVIGDAKVHTFLIQCFEWLLIATICGYFQLFISSNYPKIVLNEDCEKLCFKNEWTLVGSIFWKSSAGSDMNSNSHSVTLSIDLLNCGRLECAKLAKMCSWGQL